MGIHEAREETESWDLGTFLNGWGYYGLDRLDDWNGWMVNIGRPLHISSVAWVRDVVLLDVLRIQNSA